MKGKDYGIILALVLSIWNGIGPARAMDRTNFARGNFFQDRFCDIFCPKDESQPRLTLTDEQIQTILESDEIVQMLEENPDLLHDSSKDIDSTCLIQFNDDQRDSILAQYGGFFSSRDEAELLAASAQNVPLSNGVNLDPQQQQRLDDFLEANNPASNDTESSANDGTTGDTDNNQEPKKNSHTTILTYNSNKNQYAGGSSSGSSSGWNYRYYWPSSESGSGSNSGRRRYGSDSRRRKKRRADNLKDIENEELERSPKERLELLQEFVQKNSKRKRSASRKKTTARVKRHPEGYIPLCNAETTMETLTLAMTVDGNLVQIPQFPETELYQWFIKETCLEEVSSINQDVLCKRTSRTQRAVVLNFETPESTPIYEGTIVIESCSAFGRASAAESAKVVEEPTQPPSASEMLPT